MSTHTHQSQVSPVEWLYKEHPADAAALKRLLEALDTLDALSKREQAAKPEAARSHMRHFRRNFERFIVKEWPYKVLEGLAEFYEDLATSMAYALNVSAPGGAIPEDFNFVSSGTLSLQWDSPMLSNLKTAVHRRPFPIPVSSWRTLTATSL